jgi:hypothetical protein
MLRTAVVGILLPAALVAACSRAPGTADTAATGPAFDPAAAAAYDDTTLAFPRLRFTNGQTSVNDRCPVRKVKLNRRLPPVFVNGQPVGFC